MLRSLMYPVCCIIFCIMAAAEICPPDWHRYGESCYFIIKDKMDWYKARSTCVESRANLAIPNLQSEQDYIWKLYLKQFDQNPFTDLWIGCNDIEVEGTWQDCPLRGEPDAYENWADREPNNLFDEDCGSMVVAKNGNWDDKLCSSSIYQFHAVCERPITNTPVLCLQTGNDGRLISQYMLHHVLEELPGKSVVSCGKACRSQPRCRSFNLLEQDEGKMVCQLNNANRRQVADGDMKVNERCYFFDL